MTGAVTLMLEKAARAVGDEIGHYDTMLANKREWIDRRGVDHRGDPVDVNGPFKDDCTDIARAVLLAIREPDHDVVMAGAECVWDEPGRWSPTPPQTEQDEARNAFTTMIDTILGEKLA